MCLGVKARKANISSLQVRKNGFYNDQTNVMTVIVLPDGGAVRLSLFGFWKGERLDKVSVQWMKLDVSIYNLYI